jgi:acyl dehydratase
VTLDYDALMTHEFEELVHTYTTSDTALYALGVGLGHDPVDEAQLRFVYEKDMLALPTMATVLAASGFWLKESWTGVDWVQVLHGEQGLRLHGVLPPAATVKSQTRVTEIIDKGPGKGAFIYYDREISDVSTGDLLCTLTSTTIARGDGGFGGPTGASKPVHPIPKRDPDVICDLPTLPQAALVYRLSGDFNPLHAEPSVARDAGFERPILHGLCTLGVVGHAILKTCCDYDPARLKSLDLRFSAPVYPGETIRTEMWRDNGVVSFRARTVERDVLVLNNGHAEVQDT